MQAKSSIHIQAGRGGVLSHNDRSQPTVNTIFHDEENEVWNKKNEAFRLYREELKARSMAYSNRTGQKLQKTAIKHLSAIVNLNSHHTIDDLKKVGDLLEKRFGTRVFQMAIHRDEGRIEKDQAIKNYHAHIEFMGLDEEGVSVRKKLTKSALIQLQTDVSNLLGMERGVCYAKERKKRPKRLDTYAYKAQKQSEAPLRATIADLKETVDLYREHLKEIRAERDQYAALEKEAKILKNKIKEEGLTVAELHQQLADLKAHNQELQEDSHDQELRIHHPNGSLDEFSFSYYPSYKELYQELKEEVAQLKEEMTTLNQLFQYSHKDNMMRSDMPMEDYIRYLIHSKKTEQDEEPAHRLAYHQ